jgi:hypothetical protein
MTMKVASPPYTEGFEVFWNAYPRHVAKLDALKVWNRLRPSHEVIQAMLDALSWQTCTTEWMQDGGRFIPYPSTWLNKARWTDEQLAMPQVSERNARNLRVMLKGDDDDHH